jgi:hypothetical protein
LVWPLRGLAGTFQLRFDTIAGAASSLFPAMKATLLWFAENRSFSYLVGHYSELKQFFAEAGGATAVVKIDQRVLIGYRGASPANEVHLSKLSGFFRRWHQLGYPGVTDDAIDYLDQVRLRGNARASPYAHSIRSRDRSPASSWNR